MPNHTSRYLAVGALLTVTLIVFLVLVGAQGGSPRKAAATVPARAVIHLAPAPLPTVLIAPASKGFYVKPDRIAFGTGSAFGALVGGAYGSKIKWVYYNRTGAKAVGTMDLNDCIPDCASGTWKAIPGTATLDSPMGGHFTHLTLSYGGRTLESYLIILGRGWAWVQ